MLDLSRQYAAIGSEIEQAVLAVLRSGRFILGPEVEQMERAAASALQVEHAVGCASGTDALWLALAAAGVQPGDRVITTPFSFFATVSSILRAGATPVLADIDPLTFNICSAAVEAAVGQARAVMPVHLYGQCADMDALAQVARRHGLLVVEDAAQAFGAEWQGVRAGGLGDAAAFSFYPTKNLSAAGDAGLVTTRNSSVAEHARMLRVHGMRRRYFHDEVGWNSRLDTVQAAVLLVKLQYIDGWNRARQQAAERYATLLTQAGLTVPFDAREEHFDQQTGVVLPTIDPRGTHIFHQYVVRVPRRDAVRQSLTEQGIGSEIYYPLSLHQQHALADLGYRAGDFPASERAAREVLALPIFPEIEEREQVRVVEALGRALR